MALFGRDENSCLVIPDLVPAEVCSGLLSAVEAYRELYPPPHVFRSFGRRPLNYSVINGEEIARHLPAVSEIAAETGERVRSIYGSEFVPLDDPLVAVNINITSSGGTYRWHYDRNAVTAILYLNEVKGGETECYPDLRIAPGRQMPAAARKALDRLVQTGVVRTMFGTRRLVEPAAGKLLMMRSDRCLHSVRPVTGDEDRINIIMSFDRPGRTYSVAAGLNDYLYAARGPADGDPNYGS